MIVIQHIRWEFPQKTEEVKRTNNWKNWWMELREIERSCVWYICAFIFIVTLWWTYLMLAFAGNDSRELSLFARLGHENSVGGKYGRSEEAVFVLSVLYIKDCYLMNILGGRRRWKWFKGIVSECQLWPWKFCQREIRAIRRSCFWFLYPIMLGIAIYWTYLMGVIIRNDSRELSL